MNLTFISSCEAKKYFASPDEINVIFIPKNSFNIIQFWSVLDLWHHTWSVFFMTFYNVYAFQNWNDLNWSKINEYFSKPQQFYCQNIPYNLINKMNTHILWFVHLWECYRHLKIWIGFREVNWESSGYPISSMRKGYILYFTPVKIFF